MTTKYKQMNRVRYERRPTGLDLKGLTRAPNEVQEESFDIQKIKSNGEYVYDAVVNILAHLMTAVPFFQQAMLEAEMSAGKKRLKVVEVESEIEVGAEVLNEMRRMEGRKGFNRRWFLQKSLMGGLVKQLESRVRVREISDTRFGVKVYRGSLRIVVEGE